ncbi:MAG: sugar ABC transporter permease [Clostridia bacterium]|nr:sugar ABC transporter permease [Clostridia bacterium]
MQKQNTKILKQGSWARDFHKNWSLYLMVLPVLAFYAIFCYKPMYGLIMSFQDFNPRLGFLESEWVGFEHFRLFFTSSDFPRLLRNTLVISFSTLIISFPFPVLLAIFLNEIRSTGFKRTIQTVSYLPHFISLVVICGMIKTFVSSDGIIGQLVAVFTGERTNLLLQPKAFTPIYVISKIWQTIGWDSIIYLSALTSIDQQMYEAAEIDGAGRFKKMWHITLPSLKETMIVLLIMGVGGVMSLGYEKIMLLYSPAIYETSDVISTYVYRTGFGSQNWSYSAAIGLFNSVINLMLVITANKVARKLNGSGLW